jgi:hypothetical protein
MLRYFLLFSVLSGSIYAMTHHGGMMSHHSGNHTEHDEVNMPGLNGIDTTKQEVGDLKNIFKNHQKIKRSVVNIENGIKTSTESLDPRIKQSVVNHVVLMVQRLQNNKNPKVLIQSPTLDKLFDYFNEIKTEVMFTENGVDVIQTSSNQIVVKLLQQHASEVSDMAARGMEPIHERMMRSGKGH